jgi:hypothetical protein
MCYSKKASEISFLVNVLASYYLYNLASVQAKILALFFAFVGLMQLLDLIFWSNQDMTNPKQESINKTFTKIAMVVNHLQPIVFALLIYVFTGKIGTLSKPILFLYTAVAFYYSANIYEKLSHTLPLQPGQPLYWQWNYQSHSFPFYMLFLLSFSVLSYEHFEHPLNWTLVFINLTSFMLSFVKFKDHYIGRFWCKIAAWIPMLLILFIKMLI